MPFALAALALLWGAMLWLGGSDIDRNLLAWLYAGDNPRLACAGRMVTELGAYPVLLGLTLAALALLLWRGRRREATLLAALVVIGPLLVELLKGWIGRLRPEDQLHLVATQSFSFPSGHTANATLIWLSLAILLVTAPRFRLAAIAGAALLAVAVGASRSMLGVHWPSDVVAGWAFGLFWLILTFRIARVPLRSS